MKKKSAPDWDTFHGRKMFVPFFVFDRGDVRSLDGFCRGFGALGVGENRHQDTIGIYTAEGVYYNLLIDTRLECHVPMFFIDDEPFFYPIVGCYTMCGGVPAIDPGTGNLRSGADAMSISNEPARP